MQLESILKNS